MKQVVGFLSVLFVLFLVGCATILTGTKQDISINSSPVNATVTVKTAGGVPVFSGTTPATCKLPRKDEYIVYVSMEGYKDQQIRIGHGINEWVIGNLVCGGIPGLVVDAVTGAMWKLDPQTIHIELVIAYNDGKSQRYAILGVLDDEGRLRTLAVPMIPELD